MRTTYEADYMGPKQFGMHALHLTRNCENLEHVLNDELSAFCSTFRW